MPIDYKNYHPKWSLISHLIRFVRAGNKCEQCQAENYQPHPLTGSKVILTVAHLDHDRSHNRFYNLAALCQRCHLMHDMAQHIYNRRYGRNWKDNQIRFIDDLKPLSTLKYNKNMLNEGNLKNRNFGVFNGGLQISLFNP